jgi:Nucleoside-diphosphate-sugar pyrophosphorylase involved in lipopolysaccharide biosynthesis/translation initiation factor 2B, gamma/epsilon subunits (eIF-2Bgamma/eIF-2Bepsilon)
MISILIDEECSIFEAMEQLNKSGKRILFVLKDNKLVASLTDGDIRRGILKGKELDEKIKKIANYCPIYLFKEQVMRAESLIEKEQIDAVPIVDKNKEVIEIIFAKPDYEEIQKFDCDVPVVIMAGGSGTRLQPYTEVLPKPLIPINGMPIIEHIIRRFFKYGCNNFNIIVNYKRNMIKAYFDDIEKSYHLNYVFEDKRLGTGGGISLLQGKIDKTFILSNCDIMIDENMVDVYEKHKEQKNVITIVCAKKNYVIPYGVITINSDDKIETMLEKPEINFLTNTGCYIVEPRVIEELNYNEAIDFPEIIKSYISHNERVGVYIIQDDKWSDMGEMEKLKTVKQKLEY